MKPFILILLFCLICSKSYSQKIFTKDDLSNFVVYLGYDSLGQFYGSGTATIINDNDVYFIVTADHVIKSLKGKSYLVFKIANDRPYRIELSELTANKSYKWISHKEADIAILKFTPTDTNIIKRLKLWSFPKSQILNSNNAISRDANVLAIGYPLIDFIGDHFSPLTFNSFFSSGYITLHYLVATQNN